MFAFNARARSPLPTPVTRRSSLGARQQPLARLHQIGRQALLEGALQKRVPAQQLLPPLDLIHVQQGARRGLLRVAEAGEVQPAGARGGEPTQARLGGGAARGRARDARVDPL